MRTLGDVLYNFHWIVADDTARSAQAYAGFLERFLRHRNIRSIVNLRGPNPRFWWWRYETRICARAGVSHFDIALNSRNLPSRQLLIDMLKAFDAAPKPMMIKCSGGQDRTSFAAALYVLHREGWDSFEEAQAQFAGWPYLHWPKKQQEWLKAFPAFARQHAHGLPLAQWIAGEYTPQSFKAWLLANDMAGSFRYCPPG